MDTAAQLNAPAAASPGPVDRVDGRWLSGVVSGTPPLASLTASILTWRFDLLRHGSRETHSVTRAAASPGSGGEVPHLPAGGAM